MKGGWGPSAMWEGGGEVCARVKGCELRKNEMVRISVDGE